MQTAENWGREIQAKYPERRTGNGLVAPPPAAADFEPIVKAIRREAADFIEQDNPELAEKIRQMP